MKKLIALAGGLVLVSGAALGDQMAGATPSFSDVDTDGNGSISQAEASNYDNLAVKFSDADTNKDGELSRTEFSAIQMDMEMENPMDNMHETQ